MTTVGLVLGRFCPPHKGHSFVVERALAETERVYVIVYDAPGCPYAVERRADWLRRLHPTARVVSVPDVPDDAPSASLRQELALRRAVRERVTHVFSSEPYGERIAARFGATHVMVDAARTTIPISGTRIRQDPLGCREFLAPFVLDELGAPEGEAS